MAQQAAAATVTAGPILRWFGRGRRGRHWAVENARTHLKGYLEDDGAAPRIANEKRALERLADDQVKVYGMRRVHIQQRRPAHSAAPAPSDNDDDFCFFGKRKMRAATIMVAAACLAVACEASGVDVIRSVENPHMQVGRRAHVAAPGLFINCAVGAHNHTGCAADSRTWGAGRCTRGRQVRG